MIKGYKFEAVLPYERNSIIETTTLTRCCTPEPPPTTPKDSHPRNIANRENELPATLPMCRQHKFGRVDRSHLQQWRCGDRHIAHTTVSLTWRLYYNLMSELWFKSEAVSDT